MIVSAPGDKSLSQRALILAALSDGPSRIRGLLHGGDAESTAGALRALGVGIPDLPPDGGEITIRGVGLRGLRDPKGPLDLGNSGTGTRLLTGVLAGSGVKAVLTGDDSLRARPMGRVIRPLEAMGAGFEALEAPDRLPLEVHGTHPLRPIDWSSPMASAQVKSAILLAGLTGGTWALVTEPRRSRDHTERMLESLGVPLTEHATEGGWRVELRDPPDRLAPFEFTVPGDVSSAAFLVAAAALDPKRRPLTVEGVGLNPTRTAFLEVLRRMGVVVEIEYDPTSGEPVGSVTVQGGPMRATDVRPEEVPAMIDELPLLAVLGSRAEGVTRIRGADELRAKESDRIDAMVANLRSVGVTVGEFDDGLEVMGTDSPLSGRVEARHDHRIAMSFGVLGRSTSSPIEIDDPTVADVSFPGFWPLLEQVIAR